MKNPAFHKPKLVVILGPTATGKSELGVQLAKRFRGEVVSADSRQVYHGMDIGTGKVTKKEMSGIPHHLLGVASPKRRFTAWQYQTLAYKAIEKILRQGKLPLLVGGSPFYIYAVADGWCFPRLKPDWALRKKLERETPQELFQLLKRRDPQRAKTIEAKNKRRLIRALEIASGLGQAAVLKKEPNFDCLFLGLKQPKDKLKILINKRLSKRLRKGMIAEVRRLRESGLSWQRLEEFGLEYRWLARFLQKKITREEMRKNLQRDIERFARRQMSWFKRDKRINWVKSYREAETLLKAFLA